MMLAQRHRREVEASARYPGRYQPCTRQTMRCADARSYLSPLRPCCRAHLVELMGHVIEVFGKLRIHWWADYGTLLGAVRNPMTTAEDYPWLTGLPEGPIAAGVVPHDKDGDLGVLDADWHQIEKAAVLFRRLGHWVRLRPGTRKMKVCLSAQNHTNIDVFAWFTRPDGIMARRAYIGVDAFKGRDFPAAMLEPMTTVTWEGLTLPAPRDPEWFCAMRYGDEWDTPVAANHDGVRR
jgi:hypothetical protein